MANPPTEEGFLLFIRNVMAIPEDVLPDTAWIIDYAYCAALTIVNPVLGVVGGACEDMPSYYAMAVYNLGGHILVANAPDDPDGDHPKYWFTLRKQMGLNSWVPGVIQSSSDNGTSVSYMTPGWYETMTMADMMYLQTPWGRRVHRVGAELRPDDLGYRLMAGPLMLHLGVLDVPYAIGGKTTFEVAEILERRYHIMEVFYNVDEEGFAAELEGSLAGYIEAKMKGEQLDQQFMRDAEQWLEERFRDFLAMRELDHLGIPGVPTEAARMGYSFRKGKPRKARGPRPSFIDTGLYQSVLRAWMTEE